MDKYGKKVKEYSAKNLKKEQQTPYRKTGDGNSSRYLGKATIKTKPKTNLKPLLRTCSIPNKQILILFFS